MKQSLTVLNILLPVFLFVLCYGNLHGQTITPYAGGIGDSMSATTYGRFETPVVGAVDNHGNVYFADKDNYRIRKISTTGNVTTFAGNGTDGDYITFGTNAIYQNIPEFSGMFIDTAENVFITVYNQVLKITQTGLVTTIAGTGTSGFSGDGSIATAATLNSPSGIIYDRYGNLYIADAGNNRVRKVDTSGIITTIAGGGTLLGDGGPAVSANLSGPTAVAVDTSGNIYIADAGHSSIRKVNTSGIISTFFSGYGIYQMVLDKNQNFYLWTAYGLFELTSSFDYTNIVASTLNGFARDTAGNFYFAKTSNNQIFKKNTLGVFSVIGGDSLPTYGYAGDGGSALLAELSGCSGISVDRFGNLFMVDNSNYIRKINSSGTISTIAGSGIVGYYGDGGPATAAELDAPVATATDYAGNVYIADYGTNHVRKINTSGVIYTIAGGGSSGLGDGGPATAAEVNTAWIAADSAGDVFIADAGNNRIRKVSAATGIITSVATGLSSPNYIAVDRTGNVFFSELSGAGDIRKIDTSGVISTYSSLSGILATDSIGNLYVATPGFRGNQCIYKIDIFGYRTLIAGTGSGGYVGDNGPATAAEFINISGIAIDKTRHLYLSDGVTGCCDEGYFSAIRSICCMSNNDDNPPFFAHGNSGSFSICSGAGALNIDSLLGITDLDAGQTETWSVATAPAHGTLSGFPYHTTSTGGIVEPTGLYYTPPGSYSGVTTFTISVTDGIDVNNFGVSVTVSPLPNAGTISGASTLCTGTVVGLADGSSGGVWSSSSTYMTVSTTGAVTGVATGTGFISYSVTTGCGTAVALQAMTVHIAPNALPGIIVCQDAAPMVLPITAYSDISGSVSGAWTTTSSLISVVADSLKGITAGVGAVTYTLTDGCSSVRAVTVNPAPNAGSIHGDNSLCAGLSAILSSTAGGGTWYSSGDGRITSGGVLTGITAGMDTISYTVTNSCGTAVSTYSVVINPQPNAGTIAGPTAVCASSLIVLTDTSAGGAWSSINPRISVGVATGVVVGIAPGTAIVYYNVYNVCGGAEDSVIITVDAEPWAGTITGFTTLCAGDSTRLTDTVAGGIWSSGDPFVASMSATGELHGLDDGATFVSYTVTNACGSAVALAIVNVNAFTPIDPVTGAATLCSGLTTLLSDGTPGGTWQSGDTDVAKVNSSGLVTGINSGVAAISYEVNAGCGLSVVTSLLTVQPSPTAGTLSGPATLCAGATTAFTSTESGGTWTAANSHATISTLGITTGNSTGTDTVTYSVTNSCGTATASRTVSVYPAPATGTITGGSSACYGGTIALTDTASGGVWSSSNNAVATVGGTGLINGVAGGTAVISYLVTSGCGTAAATKTVTIGVTDAGFISGITILCAGGTTTLTDPVSGGVWTSSAPGVAAIGSETGFVNAASPGSAVIFYTVTGPCGVATATIPFTVGVLPSIAPVTGSTALCAGMNETLADATLGGSWSSSATGVATIGSAGLVHGVAAGTTTISYLVSGGCGVGGAIFSLQVQTMPSAGAIVGADSLCQAAAIRYTDTAADGVWASSNPASASVSSLGMVMGVAQGTALISYTVSNVCGSAVVWQPISVKPLPNSGIITGTAPLCVSTSLGLSETINGGVWNSAATAVATIGSAGVVTGVNAGASLISYSVTNACGSAFATASLLVIALPNSGTITGDTSFCSGDSVLLLDAAPGGVWASSNIAVANVSVTGMVHGHERGVATLFYTVVNTCGTAQSQTNVVVNAPFAGIITGITTACTGDSSLLTDSTGIGTGRWLSSTPAVASVNGVTGMVVANSAGNTVIYYADSGACGSDTANVLFTVGSSPVLPAIGGDTSVCKGSVATVTEGTPGGLWSSGNTAIALIGSSGAGFARVSGVAAGTALLSYIITEGCGTTIIQMTFHVDTAITVHAITGNHVWCNSYADTLSDATGNGTWSIANGIIATINSTGILHATDTGATLVSYTINDACGAATAFYTVSVIGTPYAGTIIGNTNLCNGANATLFDAVAGGIWSSGAPTVAGINSSGGDSVLIHALAPGAAAISYAVTNQCGTGITTTPVTIYPSDPGIISGPDTVCTGAIFKLSESQAGGIWLSGNTSVAVIDSATGQVTGVMPGAAVISYMVQSNAGACTSDTNFTVSVVGTLYFAVSGIVSPVNCYGNNNGSVSMLPGPDVYRYVWSNGDSAASINGLAPGMYRVMVTDLITNCTSADSFTVRTPDSLTVAAILTADSCKAGNGSIAVSVTGGVPPYGYLWSNNAATDAINSLTAGNYSLLITDKNQCQRSLSFDVADVTCGNNSIVIHNALTPNGDGINDTWVVEGLQKYPEASVQVFDKFGDLVYQKSNYDNTWNGQSSSGYALPDGTYFYVLKLNAPNIDGGDNVFKGAILLKR